MEHFCSNCHKPISNHSASGLCRPCYNESRKPKDGMRYCAKCSTRKPIDQFSPTSYYCKDCMAKYTNEKWKALKDDAVAYKGGKCEDCGLVAPSYMYDFHHIDPSKKDFSISKVRTLSLDKIKDELDKCVLLCSNCHRIRHYG